MKRRKNNNQKDEIKQKFVLKHKNQNLFCYKTTTVAAVCLCAEVRLYFPADCGFVLKLKASAHGYLQCCWCGAVQKSVTSLPEAKKKEDTHFKDIVVRNVHRRRTRRENPFVQIT